MLRGIAALLVVLYHVRRAINGTVYLDAGDRLFGSGACGVDLFFMISGFIMVHVTARSSGSPREVGTFLIKRWARLWPPYAIATFVMWATCASGLPFDADSLLDILRSLAFYPHEAHGAPFFGWAPLVVGWTLCYEAWFYLMFATSMAFRRARWIVLAAMFLITLVVVPLAFTGDVSASGYADYNLGPAILGIVTSPMMWEFAAGALFAAIYRSRFRIRSDFALKLMLAAAGTFFVWELFTNANRHGPLSWGIPSGLVLLSFLLAHKQMTLRIPRSLVWLGDVSFSLYLVHRIVQQALEHWLPKFHLRDWKNGGGFVLASVAFSLILAAISHRYLERGLSEWVRRALMRVFRVGAVTTKDLANGFLPGQGDGAAVERDLTAAIRSDVAVGGEVG